MYVSSVKRIDSYPEINMVIYNCQKSFKGEKKNLITKHLSCILPSNNKIINDFLRWVKSYLIMKIIFYKR